MLLLCADAPTVRQKFSDKEFHVFAKGIYWGTPPAPFLDAIQSLTIKRLLYFHQR